MKVAPYLKLRLHFVLLRCLTDTHELGLSLHGGRSIAWCGESCEPS